MGALQISQFLLNNVEIPLNEQFLQTVAVFSNAVLRYTVLIYS